MSVGVLGYYASATAIKLHSTGGSVNRVIVIYSRLLPHCSCMQRREITLTFVTIEHLPSCICSQQTPDLLVAYIASSPFK